MKARLVSLPDAPVPASRLVVGEWYDVVEHIGNGIVIVSKGMSYLVLSTRLTYVHT